MYKPCWFVYLIRLIRQKVPVSILVTLTKLTFSGFGGLLILVKIVLYTIYKIKKRRARKAEKQRRATILSTRSRGQTNQGLTNKVFDLEEEFMSPSYVRKTLRETGCVFNLVFLTMTS